MKSVVMPFNDAQRREIADMEKFYRKRAKAAERALIERFKNNPQFAQSFKPRRKA